MSALIKYAEHEARLVAEAEEKTVRENLMFLLTQPGKANADCLEWIANDEDYMTVLRELVGAVRGYSERSATEVLDAYAHRWIDGLLADEGLRTVQLAYRV